VKNRVSITRIWNRVLNFGTGSGYPVLATNHYYEPTHSAMQTSICQKRPIFRIQYFRPSKCRPWKVPQGANAPLPHPPSRRHCARTKRLGNECSEQGHAPKRFQSNSNDLSNINAPYCAPLMPRKLTFIQSYWKIQLKTTYLVWAYCYRSSSLFTC